MSLAGTHVPAGILQVILGSLGGALTVAERVGGVTGAELGRMARAAFMAGSRMGMAVGGAVALIGAVVTLAALPSRAAGRADGPDADVPADPDPGHRPVAQPHPDRAARNS